MTDFDPAHVLFFFDDQVDLMKQGDVLNKTFPSVMFCGFGQVSIKYAEGKKPGSARCPPNPFTTHTTAIETLGKYFLAHIESKHCDTAPPTSYSAPLISWLRIMAGKDQGPPRYIDMGHLMEMLWPQIEHFSALYAEPELTPWLVRYFNQDQLEIDTAVPHQTRMNLLATTNEVELYSFLTMSKYHHNQMK